MDTYITQSQQISINDLYTFLAVTVQMGSDQNPSQYIAMSILEHRQTLTVFPSAPAWCHVIVFS
jgi:hypothetical protein